MHQVILRQFKQILHKNLNFLLRYPNFSGFSLQLHLSMLSSIKSAYFRPVVPSIDHSRHKSTLIPPFLVISAVAALSSTVNAIQRLHFRFLYLPAVFSNPAAILKKAPNQSVPMLSQWVHSFFADFSQFRRSGINLLARSHVKTHCLSFCYFFLQILAKVLKN